MHAESARNFLSVQSNEFISMVNIKVKEGYDIEQVSNAISRLSDEIAVYTANKMLESIQKSVKQFSSYSKGLTILLIFFCVIAVTSIFAITINERKREFGIYILLGTSKRDLTQILIMESMIITVIGTIAGIAVSGVLLMSFHTLIATKLAIPYRKPETLELVRIILKSFVISTGVGILSTVYFVWKMVRKNGAELLEEGE